VSRVKGQNEPAGRAQNALPKGLLDGIRWCLSHGFTPEGLSERLGPVIEAIAGDVAETEAWRRRKRIAREGD
jgi:hypothetical protein